MLYELREADFHDIYHFNGAPKSMSAIGPDDIREGCGGNKCDIPSQREIHFDRYPISGDAHDLYPYPEIDVDRYLIAWEDRDLYPKPEIDVDRYAIAGDDRGSEGMKK